MFGSSITFIEYCGTVSLFIVSCILFPQLRSGNHASNVPPSQYNPLDEPSPLGLRLKKSLSLLDLIQMTLSQGSTASIMRNPTEIAGQGSKKDMGGSAALLSASDKLKASNFPASLLRIGSWEVVFKNLLSTFWLNQCVCSKIYLLMSYNNFSSSYHLTRF